MTKTYVENFSPSDNGIILVFLPLIAVTKFGGLKYRIEMKIPRFPLPHNLSLYLGNIARIRYNHNGRLSNKIVQSFIEHVHISQGNFGYFKDTAVHMSRTKPF